MPRQRLLVCVIAGVGSCTSAGAAPAAVRDPIRVTHQAHKVIVTLAPALQRAVGQYFPGFRLVRFDDYDSELPHRLAAELKVTVPFACVGDFDGNSLTDAALLLVDQRRQWRLAAFHQVPRGTFRPYRIGPREGFSEGLGDNPTGKISFYLVRQPPGKVQDPQSSDPLRSGALHLKQDAILGVWSEGASRMYYFQTGRYHYAQQGD
jgi:hypothetical protein